MQLFAILSGYSYLSSVVLRTDETGWKVGGHLWWMWAFSSSRVTAYSIQPGRGFEQAATVLGVGFEGFLVRDGRIVYREFSQAMHQTCLAHLLRRCREMILVARSGSPRVSPAACKKFCSEHFNYATVAIEAKSANWEWQ